MKFSVIVPIYKVEEYLNECIDSILHQSYDDFEVILVDDGSTDHCGRICDEYEKADERVKVIHKENGGLVSARQAGMEIAQGEYILNVDGDDYIDKDMLKNANEIINSYSPDAIYFAMMNFNSQEKWTYNECVEEGFYDNMAIKEKIYPYVLLNDDMCHLNYLITVKVVKREILKPIQLSVSTTINLGEDVACSVPLIVNVKSLYISRLPMYNYRQRDTSISKKFNSKWFDNLNECVERIKVLCSDIPNLEQQINRYLLFLTFVILCILAETKAMVQVDEVIKKVEEFQFNDRFKKARFTRITPKTRISYALIRHGNLELTYRFLRICVLIKKYIKKDGKL